MEKTKHPLRPFDQLHDDVLATILSNFTWKMIIRYRRVSKQWCSAANKCACKIDVSAGDANGNHITAIAHALSSAHSLTLLNGAQLNDESFSEARRFRQLRRLHVCDAGALEFAFRQTIAVHFSHLTEVTLTGNTRLKWSLRDLQSLPSVRVLRVEHNLELTGSLGDLSSKNFTILELSWCRQVAGNIMDLAKFQHLREVSLNRTNVVGDLRDVTKGDFPALQEIGLGDCAVYGAGGDIEVVSHAWDVMLGRYYLIQQSVSTCPIVPFLLQLDPTSPDFYYGRVQQRLYASEWDPPFSLETIVAGKRRGYRWSNLLGGSCDITWFDAEPTEPDEVAIYRDDLAKIEHSTSIFRGMSEPPSQQSYGELEKSRELT